MPFFRFFFTHHVDPIIKEAEFDAKVASDFMVVQVYDSPCSCAYVHLLEAELARTREALTQALHDHAHAKKEARKWFMIGDYFYKKITGWRPPHPPMPLGSPIHLSFDSEDSGDEFLTKLDEEVVKQKGEKKSKLKLDIM